MNYYLVTRHEVATKQLVIQYVPNQQRLVIILPQEDHYIVGFDVPWADDAFFDVLTSIGAWLVWNEGESIRTVVAYENDEGITVKINGKMWVFDKRSQLPKGDTE